MVESASERLGSPLIGQLAHADVASWRARVLLLLLVLGGGTLATTILAGLASFGASYGLGWKIGSIALSTVLLFWVGNGRTGQ